MTAVVRITQTAYAYGSRGLIALAFICLLGRMAAGEVPAPEVWSLHGQATVIEQWRGGIDSPYVGLNSLVARREDKHTVTSTLFLGRQLWPGGELYYNPEVTQGTGLSDTVGVAGFPNGEATRAGAKVPEYNTARLFLRQIFALSAQSDPVESDQNQLAGVRAVDRLVFTVGKLSATDVFDVNSYSHDPRTQLLNWALMANGAWDYPADAKGYTGGFTAEWHQRDRTFRWGIFMEPAEANGRALDDHVGRAWGQAFEWEERYTVGEHAGALRILGYWNRAHMGSYLAALQEPPGQVPDVTLSRLYRSKVGAGLNWEQELAAGLGAFARAGWNDGRTESWAFTEIDRTISAGLSIKGTLWGRANDTVAVAALANELSEDHRRYLAAGGYGFIVGDGHLNYGPEEIIEACYDWKPVSWFAVALDLQFVRNPAYNRDRGPVPVAAVRTHFEF